MKSFFKTQIVFLGISLLAVLGLGAMLILYPKAELHLLLNAYHRPWLDPLMRYGTMLATWPPFVLALLIGLFYKAGWGVYFLSSELLGIVFVQPIKAIWNMPRPIQWFADNMQDIVLPLVDGVQMHSWHSFPSGHTKTFFVMMLCLSVMMLESGTVRPQVAKAISAVLALLAIVGGYTRIYLSMHFALDVEVGAIIGLLCPMVIYGLLAHFHVFEQKWFDWHIKRMK